MKAIERHRQTQQGKSDEWLFERLDNELKQKVKEIHRLLAEKGYTAKSIDMKTAEVKPKNVIETGEYIEPNTFENESEAILFFSYLELLDYIKFLESKNE